MLHFCLLIIISELIQNALGFPEYFFIFCKYLPYLPQMPRLRLELNLPPSILRRYCVNIPLGTAGRPPVQSKFGKINVFVINLHRLIWRHFPTVLKYQQALPNARGGIPINCNILLTKVACRRQEPDPVRKRQRCRREGRVC